MAPSLNTNDGGIEVERIQAANELALARAHHRFPAVLALERQAPGWLLRLATPAGVADFERRHAIPLPEALQAYYRSLRLICLLQTAWNVDVFLTGLDSPDPPEVRTWHGKPHVVIGYFPHSDTVCGAELIGNNQYMFWEGFSENRQPDVTLADWVRGGAVRLLASAE